MSKSYVIEWKSQINGRTGKGTKRFELEEAQRLADELNREYPSIEHEPVDAGLPIEAPERAEQPEPVERGHAGAESPQITHDPDHAMAFQ